MTKPAVYVGLTIDGDIEATFYHRRGCRVLIDRRTGDMLTSTVKEGTDEFRWLIRAAREALRV